MIQCKFEIKNKQYKWPTIHIQRTNIITDKFVLSAINSIIDNDVVDARSFAGEQSLMDEILFIVIKKKFKYIKKCIKLKH